MKLDELDQRMPRCALGTLPTPLHPAPALGRIVGVPELWIKRDDLTGFSWGGNKVRTAEYILGHATAQGIDELVVCGGPSSNFVAIIAAAGRAHGMLVHQVSYGPESLIEPFAKPMALLSGERSGATITYTESARRQEMEAVSERLAVERSLFGKRALAVPRGGASPEGSVGFLRAGLEFLGQCEALGIEPGTIVLPTGSGGSAAGLLAAMGTTDRPWRILAPSVSRATGHMAEILAAKAVESATLAGLSLDPAALLSLITVVDARGAGFGVTDPDTAALSQRIQDGTGLLLDRVYNAKALRWLADQAERPERGSSSVTVYWYTGGALDAADALRDQRSETPASKA